MTTTSAWDQRSTVQRAGVATTLTGAIAAVTLIPALLAVLAPLIMADLGLSRSSFGLLITAIFVGGGLTSVWAGRIVDRLGGRRTLFLLYALTSGTIATFAATPSARWLLAAAFVAGLPGALANPVTNQVISALVPAGRRGLLIGFKQAGTQIAQVAAGLALPGLGLAFGWRGAALWVATVPLIGILATHRFLPTSLAAPLVGTPGSLAIRGPVAYLTGYGLLISLGSGAVVTYLPLYAYESLGFSLASAGLAASTAAVAGFIGRVLWGRASDSWVRPSVGLQLIAIGSVVSVLAFLGAQGLSWLVWPAAVLFGATAGAWSSVAMVALLSQVPSAVAGRASGVVLLGFYGGFIASPVLFGALADGTGSFTVGWGLVAAVFAGSLVVAALWHRGSSGTFD